jgi:hypothetical protein
MAPGFRIAGLLPGLSHGAGFSGRICAPHGSAEQSNAMS